jgi:hypothetical protein
MNVEELKEKYGPKPPSVTPPTVKQKAAMKALLAAWDRPYTGHPKQPKPPPPGAFTENERVLRLKGIIDALNPRKEKDAFRVWHRYGLSRIYFADDSWFSYSPSGVCIYGPDKEGTAYAVRAELGLNVIAKKGRL